MNYLNSFPELLPQQDLSRTIWRDESGDTTASRTRPASRYMTGNLLSAASAVDAVYITPLLKRAESSYVVGWYNNVEIICTTPVALNAGV